MNEEAKTRCQILFLEQMRVLGKDFKALSEETDISLPELDWLINAGEMLKEWKIERICKALQLTLSDYKATQRQDVEDKLMEGFDEAPWPWNEPGYDELSRN